jgi:hypothetical protein
MLNIKGIAIWFVVRKWWKYFELQLVSLNVISIRASLTAGSHSCHTDARLRSIVRSLDVLTRRYPQHSGMSARPVAGSFVTARDWSPC